MLSQKITAGNQSTNIQADNSIVIINENSENINISFNGNEITSIVRLILKLIEENIFIYAIVNGFSNNTKKFITEQLIVTKAFSDLYVRGFEGISNQSTLKTVGGSNATKQDIAAQKVILLIDKQSFLNLTQKPENIWLQYYVNANNNDLVNFLASQVPLSKDSAKILSLLISRKSSIKTAIRALDELKLFLSKKEPLIGNLIVESTRKLENSLITDKILQLLEKHINIIAPKTLIYSIESMGANATTKHYTQLNNTINRILRNIDYLDTKEREHLIWCMLSMYNTLNITPTDDLKSILKNNTYNQIPNHLLIN